jgi:hypothetical protein
MGTVPVGAPDSETVSSEGRLPTDPERSADLRPRPARVPSLGGEAGLEPIERPSQLHERAQPGQGELLQPNHLGHERIPVEPTHTPILEAAPPPRNWLFRPRRSVSRADGDRPRRGG